MNFTVDKSTFAEALEQLQGAVDRKTTIPILSHCLIEAEPHVLRLAATDLELGMRLFCPAKVEATGSGAIPARRLLDIVKSLPEGELRVHTRESERIQISAGRSSFKLAAMAKENFPTMPAAPSPPTAVPAAVLAGLIERTSFAMGGDESRHALKGALLILKPGSAEMVATDGSRLPLAGRDVEPDGLKAEERLLIPKRAVPSLRRLASAQQDGALVEIAKDDGHLFFSVGEALLISRMITGQFPDFEAVLPKSNDISATVDADAFREALERVSLLAPEGNHGIALSLDPGQITLTATAGNVGEATEPVEASYQGASLRVGFNSLFLADFLSVVKHGAIEIALKDSDSATEFRPVDQGSCRYRYIVMPMRF